MLSLEKVRFSGRACTNQAHTSFVGDLVMLVRDHHFVGGIQLAYLQGSQGIHLQVD